MDFSQLFDGPSAAIVCGGTALATVLRCGLGDCRRTLHALARLPRRFDAAAARSELAVQLQDIDRDGLIRAQPHHFGDSEFDEATDALIGRRSVDALHAAHDIHRQRRAEACGQAVRTLGQAADLAPVFGLAGTLVSLSQLAAAGTDNTAFAAAIAMAVLTTLYGLLLANLVLAPLARLVERGADTEEADRQHIVDWMARRLAGQSASAPQPHRDRPSAALPEQVA